MSTKSLFKNKIIGGIVVAILLMIGAVVSILANTNPAYAQDKVQENVVEAAPPTTAATVTTTTAAPAAKPAEYEYLWETDTVNDAKGNYAFGLPVSTYCDENRDMYIQQFDFVHNGLTFTVDGKIKGEVTPVKFKLEPGTYKSTNSEGGYIVLTIK